GRASYSSRELHPPGRPAEFPAFPLALACQVVLADPAHPDPGLPLACVHPHDNRDVLRAPLHRPLPTRDLRLQPRRSTLDVARRGGRGGVGFSSPGARAPARSPPFSLGEEPDYPARLEIDYPEWQRKGLPLIGWWFLGAPQYAIAGVIAGGGGYASAGVIGILVFIVAMLLLFKDTYRDDVFDVLMGFNRWCLPALAVP